MGTNERVLWFECKVHCSPKADIDMVAVDKTHDGNLILCVFWGFLSKLHLFINFLPFHSIACSLHEVQHVVKLEFSVFFSFLMYLSAFTSNMFYRGLIKSKLFSGNVANIWTLLRYASWSTMQYFDAWFIVSQTSLMNFVLALCCLPTLVSYSACEQSWVNKQMKA